jgi:hypothetical protein|tara:strand:- start:2459 stop:3439 length:981 start_codon:yes stop_codon:yes gene_type:complete
MAFLDNSGDIILDAVLTDTGRKRMADGNFKITRFGLGDDEINYSQYDKNNASGSAYYDLEILQTPIMQSTTQVSNINYGLLNLSNKNILYMPSLKVNSLQTGMQEIYSGIYYVATNATTVSALNTFGLTSDQYQDNTTAQISAIYIEGGINSSDLAKTQSNQSSYVKNLGLSNSNYMISVDNRIFKGVMGPSGPGQPFTVNADGSNFRMPTNLKSIIAATSDSNMENYSSYRVIGVNNAVYQTQTGVSVANFSAITGPGDTVTCIKTMVHDALCSSTTSDNLYSKIGSTGASLFGSTYDYIDTFVYITGATTGATIGLPVRVLRKV